MSEQPPERFPEPPSAGGWAGVPPHPYWNPGYPPQTDNQSIVALVLSIAAIPVGLFCYGIPGIALGLLGFFLGRNSAHRIRMSQGRLTGEGMAKGAWITGLAAAILSAAWMLLVIGFFAFFIYGSSHGMFPTPTVQPSLPPSP